MTQAPHLLPKSREGMKFGDMKLVDSMSYDGLWDVFTTQAMGALTEARNAELGISREEQDAFSARSHQRAAEAWKNGLFDDEVVSVEIPQRKGDPISFRDDEGIRPDTTAETLGQAAPGLQQGRHHHRRLVVADLRRCGRGRRDEQGQGRGAGTDLAGRDRRPRRRRPAPTRPCSRSRRQRSARPARKEGISPADLDLVEINEAFASVGIKSMRDLGLGEDKVNVNGGAIALGHPIGMSGARIVLHLALELQRRGGGVGAAALCGGGGQGDALIIRVPKA